MTTKHNNEKKEIFLNAHTKKVSEKEKCAQTKKNKEEKSTTE
jgi:hypothetical protein